MESQLMKPLLQFFQKLPLCALEVDLRNAFLRFSNEQVRMYRSIFKGPKDPIVFEGVHLCKANRWRQWRNQDVESNLEIIFN